MLKDSYKANLSERLSQGADKRGRTQLNLDESNASSLVRRFAVQISNAAGSMPIVDVACGSGRNALALARLDCLVLCVDKDLTHLQNHPPNLIARLKPQELDLVRDPWPFEPGSVGGIVNVHFLLPSLFPLFTSSLVNGGYLLIETVPGCGGNYLELPKAGELKAAFAQHFDFLYYKERKAGPLGVDAAVVQMVARRRSSITELPNE